MGVIIIDIFGLIRLIGGVAIFLFGMKLMGEALELRAGNQLKGILSKLTTNKYKGFFLGLGVTAVIQSSSATAVMVVGFVNSGLMVLSQGINVIIGANLGTTMTGWLLSLASISGGAWYLNILKTTTFVPILALIGVVFYNFLKDKKKKYVGLALLGFSILMLGMQEMSSAVKPLGEIEGFQKLFIAFSNPFVGVLIGALLTVIIQSSSATVGILQALSMSGLVSLGISIPLVMGMNIGASGIVLISAVGANKNAKRSALVYLYFNVLGTIVYIIPYLITRYYFNLSILDTAASPVIVAIIHTAFNLLTVFITLPFTRQLEWLVKKSIKDTEELEEAKLLDKRFLQTPAVALNSSRTYAINMGEIAVEAIYEACDILETYDKHKAEKVRDMESKVDEMEDMLGSYLVKLSTVNLTEEIGREITKLLHLLNDFERISDHAVNIVESAEEIHDKKLAFSHQANYEISVMIEAVKEILHLSIMAFKDNDLEYAYKVEPLEEVIDYLMIQLKNQHIQRLQKNECTIELGFVLTDIITNLERVADHCSNVAANLIEASKNSLELHHYLKIVDKGPGSQFETYMNEYLEKYSINKK